MNGLILGLLLTAAGAKDLTIEWKDNFLAIKGEGVPGGTIAIHYLEAYCRSGSTNRDWRETVIPHKTELEYADARKIRLRCRVGEAVEVLHDIVAGDDEVSFQLKCFNSGNRFEDVQWAQPCMRVDRFTGLGQSDYFRKAFIVLERGPTFLDATRRGDKALYIPGQVYVPRGIDRNDVNPRPLSPETPTDPLIGAVSADGSKIVAMAWDNTQELFQGVAVCIHADLRIGGIHPGETKAIRGKIYIVPNDVDALVARCRRDFPPAATSANETRRPSSSSKSSDKGNPQFDGRRRYDVVIRRDAWGVPHIEGKTDVDAVFGFAYAQCEDFFWQVEETYIQALGRYAEVAGETGVLSDLKNRAFEIAAKSQRDFPGLEPEVRELCAAFTDGVNRFLETHPEVKPRLIGRFEPWQVLACMRHLGLTLCTVHGDVPTVRVPRADGKEAQPVASQFDWTRELAGHVGSNAWAIGPSRTRSGKPILLINPHQPWYGYGQFYEAHLRSEAGLNFTGAAFFGFPLPCLGRNERLGWAFTFNEPNLLHSDRLQFDDPHDPDSFQRDGVRGRADRRNEVVRVLQSKGLESRTYVFRKVGADPVLEYHPAADAGQRTRPSRTLRLPEFERLCFLRQAWKMARASNFAEFRTAMAMQELPLFNTVYADVDGNIFYLYNAVVERRPRPAAPSGLPKILTLDELPQILNPRCGYVQSCNASPFRTCEDEDNPSPGDFAPWLSLRDFGDDKRRSKMSRRLLSRLENATLEDVERLAFDTTSYWALTELPKYRQALERLQESRPALAARAKPYLDHLLDWDCRGGGESTQMTLCVAWYDLLYGRGYPGETLKDEFREEPARRLQALVDAAESLKSLYGDWKVRWKEVYRIQRHANVSEFLRLPLSDSKPSLPSQGIPGPLGVVFTQYYSPQVQAPLLVNLKRRYGVVGTSYLSVVEFTEKPRGKSLVQFGSSGMPDSPHFLDQAALLSDMRMKPQWFETEDVDRQTGRHYRP